MSLLSIKVVRYAVVGILTLVVYLGAGAAMQKIGLAINLLAPLAFTAAVSVNYLMQRLWVFADSRPVTASLPKYVFMITIGYILNSFTLMSLAPHMSLVWAQSAAAIVVIISNAFFSFLWVFSMRRGD